MPDKQVRIDLTAKDDASKKIDEVAEAVEDLEKQSPEIEITADDKASADIKDVRSEAEALSKADAEVILKARADAAKAELQALRDDLKQTGERAEDTAKELDKVGGDPGGGLKTRGNAIADLTGPLGEASSAASDFAGVFDGIGDIAEDMASKLGASAASTAALSSVVGGLGIAVAAGAAAWSFFKQRQQAAAEAQAKLLEQTKSLTKAMKDNDAQAVGSQLLEMFPEAAKAAQKAGVPIEELFAFITGQKPKLLTVQGAMTELNAEFARTGEFTPAQRDAADALLETLNAATSAREELKTTNAELLKTEENTRAAARGAGFLADTTETAARDMGAAFDKFDQKQESVFRGTRTQANLTEQAFDRLRGSLDMEQALLNLEQQVATALEKTDGHAQATQEEILGIKQSIIDAAQQAGLTPIEAKALVQNVTPQNVADVYAYAKALIDQKGALKLQAEIQAAVDLQMKTRSVRVGPLTPDNEAARSSTTSTQVINFPRGMSVNAAMQLARSQSRNGRYYQGAGR